MWISKEMCCDSFGICLPLGTFPTNLSANGPRFVALVDLSFH